MFHLPGLIGIVDPEMRAQALVAVIDAVVSHDQLTTEQRVIARWLFTPPAESQELFLHERRQAVAEELDSVGASNAPKLTRKQIEDREARLLPLLARLLLDPAFMQDLLGPLGAQTGTHAPADPYEPKGYEWVESVHRLVFDDHDPRTQRLSYSIVVRARRRDQRLFWIRHDPIVDGSELPVEVLSSGDGHELLGRVADPRPHQARAHLLFFYLGRALQPGETTTLIFERGFQQASLGQPWFGMEMDDTAQERLRLEVYLPAGMGCRSWAKETWSSGDANVESASGRSRASPKTTSSLGSGTWSVSAEIERIRSAFVTVRPGSALTDEDRRRDAFELDAELTDRATGEAPRVVPGGFPANLVGSDGRVVDWPASTTTITSASCSHCAEGVWHCSTDEHGVERTDAQPERCLKVGAVGTAPGGLYQASVVRWDKRSSGGRVLVLEIERDTTFVAQAEYTVDGSAWQRVKLSQASDSDSDRRTSQAFTMLAADRIYDALQAGDLPPSTIVVTDSEVDRAMAYVKIDQELPIDLTPGTVVLEVSIA